MRRHSLALLLVLPFAPLGAQLPTAAPLADRWFRGTMGGTPVGYMHERTMRNPDESVRATSEMLIVLTRLGKRVEIGATTEAHEDATGAFRDAVTKVVASRDTTIVEATAEPSRVALVRRVAGRSFTSALPFEGRLLGGDGVRGRTMRELTAPGDSIVYQAFLLDLGTVARVVRRMVGRDRVTCEGGSIDALKIEERSSASPVVSILWIDGEGRLVQMEQPSPFGVSRFTWDDEASARAAAGGAELPEERYASTIVRTQVRLPRVREVSAITLELRHRDPALGWPAFASQDQRVIATSPDRLTLTITRPSAPRPARFPVPITDATRPFLEPNAYVQSRDSAMVALATRIVGGERELYRAALRLRRWVADSMHFDAGIVAAPSTELLRDRRGTCVGYATLLAALTRATGIPSRVAMGYVYLNGMFGGHAWTEILARDRWIPLDAALPSQGVADAARFAFTWTSMESGASALSAGGGVQLYGKLDVRMLSFTPNGGSPRDVRAEQAPYVVTGDRYVNAGLGLSLTKPAALTFESLDETWPSPLVLGMRGANGAKVTLEQRHSNPWLRGDSVARVMLDSVVPGGRRDSWRVAGRDVPVVKAESRAALIVPMGSELFVLSSVGPHAVELLRQAIARLTW